MKMYVFALVIFVVNMNISYTSYAEEKARFDFQKYIGEREYDLYRVEVDFSKQSGELCVLRTAWSNVPDEVIEKLSKNTLWTKFIDMQKYNHACFKFSMYEPFGWFYSQPFSYGDHEYRFFFIGNLNKKSMKGTLYQFIDHQEGDKKHKFVDDVDVSTQVVIMK